MKKLTVRDLYDRVLMSDGDGQGVTFFLEYDELTDDLAYVFCATKGVWLDTPLFLIGGYGNYITSESATEDDDLFNETIFDTLIDFFEFNGIEFVYVDEKDGDING